MPTHTRDKIKPTRLSKGTVMKRNRKSTEQNQKST